MDESLPGAATALRDARVYLVCDANPAARDLESVLRAALEGGVDLIQLRDKTLDEPGLVGAAATFRALASEFNVPFLLNDRADLVTLCQADGVHVGQDDAPVGRARELAGSGGIVGLSTHSPEQLRAAYEAVGDSRPDYVSVGPVWPTPTKEGRPATGLEYVRLAAEDAPLPWFAIGGIDGSNVSDVARAGATRIAVVRAIRDAPNIEAAARALRGALEARQPAEPPGDVAASPGSTRAGAHDHPGVAATSPLRDH